jgi:hypothetical protein
MRTKPVRRERHVHDNDANTPSNTNTNTSSSGKPVHDGKEVTETTEQSINFSGLEVRSSDQSDGKEKDATRPLDSKREREREIVSGFHSKLKSRHVRLLFCP